jgi:hypothetical protein
MTGAVRWSVLALPNAGPERVCHFAPGVPYLDKEALGAVAGARRPSQCPFFLPVVPVDPDELPPLALRP